HRPHAGLPDIDHPRVPDRTRRFVTRTQPHGGESLAHADGHDRTSLDPRVPVPAGNENSDPFALGAEISIADHRAQGLLAALHDLRQRRNVVGAFGIDPLAEAWLPFALANLQALVPEAVEPLEGHPVMVPPPASPCAWEI